MAEALYYKTHPVQKMAHIHTN